VLATVRYNETGELQNCMWRIKGPNNLLLNGKLALQNSGNEETVAVHVPELFSFLKMTGCSVKTKAMFSIYNCSGGVTDEAAYIQLNDVRREECLVR
jgi:hypothetical protein